MPSEAVTSAEFDLGRAALLEITSPDTIGANAGWIDEGEGVVSVHFETTMGGYPGWHWTVSIARLGGAEPSVLETELLPGDGALLAPDWIPWVDRLADYRAAQEAAGLAPDEVDADSSIDDDADNDDDDDDDDDDEHDLDDLDDHIDDDDELVVPAVGVDDANQAEGDADDAGPEPPAIATADERGEEQQEHDKGD
ncbi:MAG: DUF3027 domain-containing protein [Lacisediminihabitans sp.]